MQRFILFISILLTAATSLKAQEKSRPNIIFILTDDQRWDALGYAGNKIIQTPNMDKLASEGMYFKNAFVTTPICAASRASIMTGLYERTHDFTFATPPLKQAYVANSYPQKLKDAGYYLGFFGKFGMEWENNSDTTLFDESFYAMPEGYFRLTGAGGFSKHIHLTDLTTDKAMEFIKKAPADKPFCISLSYNAPHADDHTPIQYFWPERNDKLYTDVVIPDPLLSDKRSFDALPPFIQDSLYMGRIRWHWRYDDPEKYQRMVKGYYRMITTIDDNLGRLRTLLADMKIADNTIIILMGDNGYFLGERNLAGKWLMYENSLRVPLILYDPQAKRKATSEVMALNIDIAPTILDYAGLPIPSSMQGQSLRPFTTQDIPWRDEFLCEHLYNLSYIPKSEGIRTTRWKYFRYVDHPDVEELYDLQTDPLEKNNLVLNSKYKKQLQQFRNTLNKKISTLDAASVK